ncbi:hypothetical protein L0663_01320 [Dyadobacter sp. CY107]|uniref:hypothetical protein n=1 Tax=Dyadobacter fanqingshengii TaxID=2906443 RepID=UPI001F23FE8D|nr:hypothetical protein [Dyadobacter fanqingshengii]MCF2502004.1 hypothetical protein [Dyadobacter fanqingshengii]
MSEQAALMMDNNLSQVWNERDSDARLKAIEKIYDIAANLYHVGDHVTGFESINNSVTSTLKHLPAVV